MNKIIYSSWRYFLSDKALRIVLIYSIISLLWIYFSDELLFKLFLNVAAQKSISIFKGWLFVIITSLLLYKLIKNAIREVVSTEQKLRDSEQYSRMLFETSSIGLALTKLDGKFVDVNPAYVKIIGRTIEETLKLDYWDITPKIYISQEQQQLEDLGKTGHYGPYEKEYIHKDGHHVPVRLQGSIIERNGEKYIWSSVEDITERKRSEEELRESEEKFRTLTETTSAAIFIFKGEFFRYINSFAEQITGYKKEELLNKKFWEIVHPDYRDLIKERGLSRQRGELVPQRYEFKILTKAGEERWLDFTAGVISYEGALSGIGTAMDITEQKRTEALLIASTEQMRSLAAHLQTIREEERASIAREMHDELGQILTSLKMNITFTRKELEESELNEKKEKLLDELSSMNQTVDRAVTQVRKLITQLRPELIDKLGLIAALEWYSEEYQKTTKIKCEFKTDQEELSLNHDTDLAIFRIVQEALTNAAKHSEAKTVKIHFMKTEDKLSLEIIDDGKGISEEELEGKKSFGLMGMRERASLIGGRLEICRAEEKGTIVRLVIEYK
jgi:PAS domain S-box-containing protein